MSQETLPKYDLKELARPMIALLDESRDQTIGQVKIHQILLEGKPVSPERIAAHLRLTQAEVATLLRGAELDQDGNLVGLGLSLVPTSHSYRIHGRQLYTWCAFDAIMFPIFHQANVEIESPDPISGEKIRLTSTPEGVRDVDPVTAVVSWVPGKESREDVRDWFCNYTNFFTSVETAAEYVVKHPGLVIVPIDQAFRIGQLMWEREPYKSMIDELSIKEQTS
ncbi:MAG TPA: organomercurial lyase [Anaerolineales bacterium]|jgi:alkylmercury lyase|nr:organomercurial lyase [Anaerolineales bacterium]